MGLATKTMRLAYLHYKVERNFQFIIRIIKSLTSKFANLLIFIFLLLLTYIFWLGEKNPTPIIYKSASLELYFCSSPVRTFWVIFLIHSQSYSAPLPFLPVALQLLLWLSTFATCAQEWSWISGIKYFLQSKILSCHSPWQNSQWH